MRAWDGGECLPKAGCSRSDPVGEWLQCAQSRKLGLIAINGSAAVKDRRPGRHTRVFSVESKSTNCNAMDLAYFYHWLMKPKHISQLQCLSLRGLAMVSQCDSPPPFNPSRDLDLQSINVFAGPNGCGKTTVLDAVRSIFEPELLARLRRENIPADAVSGFQIRFADGASVRASFHQTGAAQDDEQTLEWDWQHTQMTVVLPSAGCKPVPVTAESNLPVRGPVSGQHLLPFIRALAMLAREGASWPRTKSSALELKDYLSILPRFQHLFPKNEWPHQEAGPKLAAKAGDLSEANGELHQHHGDDLFQSSRVLPEYLPSGWKQVVDLLSWVEKCERDSVCVIDEPERHLHPLLQRALIAELAVLGSERGLQLIIATHSPSFLNRRAWGRDVAVFHLMGGHVVREPDITAILDQLGCVASDLCQTNGVVWVEGPSDRIYINAFLRAWRSQRALHKSSWIENVHFSYAFFDGSCLVHFSGLTSPNSSSFNGDDAALFVQVGEDIEERPEDLIQLLRLNRNAAICIDRDNDFAIDDFGSLIAKKTLGRTKLRVSTELAATGAGPIHITDGYTMECYVAEVMPRGFLQVSEGRVAVGGNKVKHALRFSRLSDVKIATCFELHPGLCNFVRKLDSAIKQWNG